MKLFPSTSETLSNNPEKTEILELCLLLIQWYCLINFHRINLEWKLKIHIYSLRPAFSPLLLTAGSYASSARQERKGAVHGKERWETQVISSLLGGWEFSAWSSSSEGGCALCTVAPRGVGVSAGVWLVRLSSQSMGGSVEVDLEQRTFLLQFLAHWVISVLRATYITFHQPIWDE